MGARRPAFALMLVLGATAMVFAMAISGAVAIRSATIEASAMRDRAAIEREARSAMAIVLAGLTGSDATFDETQITTDGAGGAGGDDPSSVDDFELPPFPAGLPLNLGSSDGEEDDSQGTSGSSSGSASTQTKRRGAFGMLRMIGLPAEPIRIEINGADYLVKMEDALGGVDINGADEQRLIDYFELAGLSQTSAVAIAHQIVDWRDEDSFRRPHGAERDDYRRRHIAIRNAKFESIEELRYLPAMTSGAFDLIREDLCVGSDGKTYVGASRAALGAVPGITGSAIRSIETRHASGGVMTNNELRDILGVSADTVGPNLRTTPSNRLRVVVEPVAHEGVRIVGEASVSDRRGVRIGAVSFR